ncbi:MAG: urocanate hydratase [Phycisphaera sp.]|nr:MAG: urocanate hydratase [Phycisphaera sp.]
MTDPGLADATYIEPITPEFVEKVIARERPDALLPTMGGQTALNCALDLEHAGILKKYNVEMIGARADVIEKAEDREKFRVAMDKIGLENPRSAIASSPAIKDDDGKIIGYDRASGVASAIAFIEDIGLPAIIRPAFTLGGMGGAQPLAVTLAEGTCLIADVDLTRLERRCQDNYLDEIVEGIDAAIDRAVELAQSGKAVSVGVHANSVDLLERMLERNITPDVLTDQTSAHDPLQGYVPVEYTFEQAAAARASDPVAYQKLSLASMVRHVRAMVELQKRGAITFDYGNNIRQRALDNGFADAFTFPGFVPAYIREQFCVGRGPFRWVALSGDPVDIYKTDHALLKLFPEDASEYGERLHRWILGCHKNPEALLAGDYAKCEPRFGWQGLPARICWFGLGERDKAGIKINDMVASGELSAPIVIGRDHLDCGSVASPNRETEGMLDGSDAISDWALLNAMVNVASGASWVSFHHGGGVGIGFSQHAGQVIVADGTPEASARLARVLSNDPMMGIFRHADAGYETAKACANDQDVDIPMR